jgi:prepilin-type N-terminal cleavage/methylation domain-containing protein
MKMKNLPGFTITELLVTIVIIAVLTSIAVPMSISMVNKSRETKCLGNLKEIGLGLQVYISDNNDYLPVLAMGRTSKNSPEAVLETELKGYIESEEVFHCPADKTEFRETGSSYYWNVTQNGRLITELSFLGVEGRPEMVPLVSDKEAWHAEKTNFLYADSSSSNKTRFVTSK